MTEYLGKIFHNEKEKPPKNCGIGVDRTLNLQKKGGGFSTIVGMPFPHGSGLSCAILLPSDGLGTTTGTLKNFYSWPGLGDLRAPGTLPPGITSNLDPLVYIL